MVPKEDSGLPAESTGEPAGPTPTRTAELLRRALEGNSDAEQRLFEVHRGILIEEARHLRAMRVLREVTSEEDLVDEVFIRILSAGLLHEFSDRGEGSLRQLLSRVLLFVVRDACRRHGARKRRPAQRLLTAGDQGDGRHLAEILASNWTTPTGRARANELMASCRRILDDREWRLWQLAELKGLSSVEIGHQETMTASAVRGALLRIRKKLVHELDASDAGS